MSSKTLFTPGIVFGAFVAITSLFYIVTNPSANYLYAIITALGILQIFASIDLNTTKKRILLFIYYTELLYCVGVIIAILFMTNDILTIIAFVAPLVVVIMPLLIYLIYAIRKFD